MNFKIFYTDNIIKEEDKLKKYDYIKPKDLKTYIFLMNNSKYKYKTLFPSNHFNIKEKIYANLEIQSKLTNLYYSNNINDCYLFLYNMDIELEKIEDYTNFIKHGNMYKLSKNMDSNLKQINNFINLNNSIKNNNENKDKNFFNNISKNYIELEFDIKNTNKVYNLDKNKLYSIKRKGTLIYNYDNLLFDFIKKNYFQNYNIILYKIDNVSDKEFIILCKFKNNISIKLIDLLKKHNEIDNDVVGYNKSIIDYKMLYYIYGQAKLLELYYPLSELHNHHMKVLINDNLKYNYRKFIRFYAFNRGSNNKRLNLSEIEKKYKNKKLQKVLLISKSIKGYGGNQKTAKQLYLNLSSKYDLYVLSLAPSDYDKFDYKKDSLCDLIHNDDIIKLKSYDDIVNHINNTNYDIVINNKLNELFKIIIRLNKKINIISHNSMDPFNRMILNNQRNIDKVFTINKIHSDLLIKNKLKCKLMRFVNYVDVENKITNRDDFKYRIVFVGRLSNEKNVNLLLNAFEHINKNTILKNKLELVILGDGKEKFFKNIDNVVYYGKVDFSFVKLVLINSDYLILPSSVEGLPFTVLEAMSLGIPCICSNINGVNEVVNKKNGFLFDLYDYDKYKNNIDNWKVMKCVEDNLDRNKNLLISKILEAYEISINKWNRLSNKSYNDIKNKFNRGYADRYNFTSFYLF